jgi:hypothetical protein
MASSYRVAVGVIVVEDGEPGGLFALRFMLRFGAKGLRKSLAQFHAITEGSSLLS